MSMVEVDKIGVEYLRFSIGKDYLLARQSSGGTVEILDIEVSSERRVGIGRKLVEALLKQVPEAPTVYAITRISNEVAQQFYENLGFDKVSVIRRFYRDSPFPHGKAADAIVYGRSPKGPV